MDLCAVTERTVGSCVVHVDNKPNCGKNTRRHGSLWWERVKCRWEDRTTSTGSIRVLLSVYLVMHAQLVSIRFSAHITADLL